MNGKRIILGGVAAGLVMAVLSASIGGLVAGVLYAEATAPANVP